MSQGGGHVPSPYHVNAQISAQMHPCAPAPSHHAQVPTSTLTWASCETLDNSKPAAKKSTTHVVPELD